MNFKLQNRVKLVLLLFVSLLILTSGRAFASDQLRANGKIAFTSDRDGNREIYVMNSDGTEQLRVTNDPLVDDHPTWSPDGRKLAILSQRVTGEYAIFAMNPDGTGKTEITHVNYQPGWPWNGWDAWAMSWSPDGQQIVFSNGPPASSTLAIVNSDGTSRRDLTTGFGPAWSPDGSRILFLRTAAGSNSMLTIRTDGSDLRSITPKLVPFYTLTAAVPGWAPDGLKIIFGSYDGTNFIINTANPDGSNTEDFYGSCAVRVPQGCSGAMLPAWSPDGSTIAFTNWGQMSGSEIYIKNFAEPEATRLTNSSGINTNPAWQSLAPHVSVSGRVIKPGGQGLANAVVLMTGPLGVTRTATTSTFGYYSFENIPAGDTYTLSVASRRYRFPLRDVVVLDNLTDIDLVGLE